VYEAMLEWTCASYRKILIQQQVLQWSQLASGYPNVNEDVTRLLTRLKEKELASGFGEVMMNTMELKDNMFSNDSAAIDTLTIPTSPEDDRKFLASLHHIEPSPPDEIPQLQFHSLSSSRSDSGDLKKKTTKKKREAVAVVSS